MISWKTTLIRLIYFDRQNYQKKIGRKVVPFEKQPPTPLRKMVFMSVIRRQGGWLPNKPNKSLPPKKRATFIQPNSRREGGWEELKN